MIDQLGMSFYHYCWSNHCRKDQTTIKPFLLNLVHFIVLFKSIKLSIVISSFNKDETQQNLCMDTFGKNFLKCETSAVEYYLRLVYKEKINIHR